MSDTPVAEKTDPARLSLGRVLAALGRAGDAEAIALEILDKNPDDLTALSLLAKVKHLRGELSQAIALWAAIQMRAPRDTALVQLTALRRLAESPEQSAGEFVALGDGRMVRKHLAQIELERAFGLLMQGRVNDAVVVCESVAERHKRRDRDVYKLATLARAWIRELTGNYQGARAALEGLGAERGFETDVDRLTMLARIYERLGRPEDISSAIKVHLHLIETAARLSTHALLAHLYCLAGDERASADAARRYLIGFRRRMHKVTIEDLVRAATQRYLPIRELARVTTITLDDDPPTPGPLAAGIRYALSGEREKAETPLSDAGPLGAAYRGDLRLMDGDEAGATELWSEALMAGGRIEIGIVQALAERRAGLIPLQRLAADEARLHEALGLMLEAARSEPGDAASWNRLATLERIASRDEDAERHADKAMALAEAGPFLKHPGRVLSAAAYRFVGKTKGLIHELWADRHPVEARRGGALDPAHMHGNLAAELVESTKNAFVATRQYARAKFPHLCRDLDDYRYSFKVTKEDEPSGGLSAGLPTALAFFSLFVGRPVPDDLALTGTLVADAHDVLAVRNVGDIEPKIKGAYNRELRMLIVPAESKPDVERLLLVPPEVSRELVRYAATFDEALELVYGHEVWEW